MEDPRRLLRELSSKATSGNFAFPLVLLALLLVLLVVLWQFFSSLLALAADWQTVTSLPSGRLTLMGILALSLVGTIVVTMGWWVLRLQKKNTNLREEVAALRRCIEEIKQVIFASVPGDISRQAKLRRDVKWLKARGRDFKVKQVMELGGQTYLLLDGGEHSQIQPGMHFRVFGETGGVCRGQVEDVSREEAKLRLYPHEENTEDYWGDVGHIARPFSQFRHQEGRAETEREIVLLHLVVDLLSDIGIVIKEYENDNPSD